MLNLFLQTEPQVENLIVPDSVQKARFTQAVTELANIDIKDVWQQMVEWMIWTGIKVCIALVVFYIGRWLLGKFFKIVEAFLSRRKIDLSLRSFAITATKVLGYAALFIVIFKGTRNAVIQKSEIDTHIIGRGFFPFQVRTITIRFQQIRT